MADLRNSLRGRPLFSPILPGATARDRALACVGVVVGIGLVGLLGALVHGDGEALPWIVAPMGASAVLLFVVPASPMSQPWPIVGGNGLSAFVGFVVGQALGHGAIACGLAVGLAIAVMSVTRSLHPPGGAAALTGVLGGSLVDSAGWWFPLAPVALNALVLVAFGWLFHRYLSGHPYPHVQAAVPVTRDPLPTERVGVREEDLDAVLAGIGETFDIEREDLRLLLAQLEAQALARQHSDLTCEEIMSRDVITVGRDADPEVARALLLESGVRLLPVLDGGGRPVGGVGLRELARPARVVADVMTPPLTIGPAQPAVALTSALTDGHRHAAMVVDPDSGKLLGLVTQADLLAALTRRSVDAALSAPPRA
ncbi:MAG TPA: HPP family protein [Solirubrobacterales bacterium]|nr:HPP family protein [Solirubrobacterales bacterium]